MRTRCKTLLSPTDRASETERILLDHLPVVRSIAGRIHKRLPQNVDFDDLFSAGMIGLMGATANFNPAKNTSFKGYAQFRIQGAILDSLRSLDWAPRQLRRKGRLVQEAIQALTARRGHAPSEADVATELKLSLDEYQQLRADLNGLEIGSLHRTEDEVTGEEELANIPGRPEDDSLFRYLRIEMEERLTKAIEELSERERLVITSYYYEEMTMLEIGLALGVSWTRVRQIHGSAVLRLRAALSDPSSRGSQDNSRIHRGRCKASESASLSMSAA